MDGGVGLYRAYRISPLRERIARVLHAKGDFYICVFMDWGIWGVPVWLFYN
jgi:hypothetical protein